MIQRLLVFWILGFALAASPGCMKADEAPPMTARPTAGAENTASPALQDGAKPATEPTELSSKVFPAAPEEQGITPEAAYIGGAPVQVGGEGGESAAANQKPTDFKPLAGKEPAPSVRHNEFADHGWVDSQVAGKKKEKDGLSGETLERRPQAQGAAAGSVEALGDGLVQNQPIMENAFESSIVKPIIDNDKRVEVAKIADRNGTITTRSEPQRDDNDDDEVKLDIPESDVIEEEVLEEEEAEERLVDRKGEKLNLQNGRRQNAAKPVRSLDSLGPIHDPTGGSGDDDQRPEQFLPPMFYFDNTYLGGNAAYAERMRRIWGKNPDLAGAVESLLAFPQQFDVPVDAGMALVADLDRTHFERPGRVYLQVGLRGSDRYGWRRPPLDVGLILALGPEMEHTAVDVVQTLLRKLGTQDRVSIVEISETPVLVADLDRIKKVRSRLSWGWKPSGTLPDSNGVVKGMQLAAESLRQGNELDSVVVGSKVLLLVTGSVDPSVALAAASQSHALTVEGFVTSVIEVSPTHEGELWQVADAGHGGYHRAESDGLEAALDAELSMLSQVVARLLRLNIRLSKSVHCIRVLGAKVLTLQQVAEVKSREEATDRQLSKTMGIAADRGQDDDGAQTVIPYFLGGDSHVVVLELWVDEPGPIADITLRYKDMVHLRNGTAKTSVTLRNHKRQETPREFAVRANLEGLRFAESLAATAARLQSGDGWADGEFAAWKGSGFLTDRDLAAVKQLERLAPTLTRDIAVDALQLGSARKLGQSFRD